MLYFLNYRNSSSLRAQKSYSRHSGDRRKRKNIFVRSHISPAEFVPALILFTVLFFLLWVRIENVTIHYNLEAERSQSLNLDSQLRQLRLDYAYLTRHNYLREKAQQELALVSRNPEDVRILRR